MQRHGYRSNYQGTNGTEKAYRRIARPRVKEDLRSKRDESPRRTLNKPPRQRGYREEYENYSNGYPDSQGYGRTSRNYHRAPPPPPPPPRPSPYAPRPPVPGRQPIVIQLPAGYTGPIPPPLSVVASQLANHIPKDQIDSLVVESGQTSIGSPEQTATLPGQATYPSSSSHSTQQQQQPQPQQQQQQQQQQQNSAMWQPSPQTIPKTQDGPQHSLQGMGSITSATSNPAGLAVWGASAGNNPAAQAGSHAQNNIQSKGVERGQPPNNFNSYSNFLPQTQSMSAFQQSDTLPMNTQAPPNLGATGFRNISQSASGSSASRFSPGVIA